MITLGVFARHKLSGNRKSACKTFFSLRGSHGWHAIHRFLRGSHGWHAALCVVRNAAAPHYFIVLSALGCRIPPD
jgi:hypothetical protein